MAELLVTEEKAVSQAALEVLDRLRTGEFAEALDEFLLMYPKVSEVQSGADPRERVGDCRMCCGSLLPIVWRDRGTGRCCGMR